ncbi:unnamed protein product [Urochloa decumbens]|uniref:Myb-like domain-containing protein n=1 Tax=Urochloa decumbens TaxID=240449 RepID=A0ABC8Z574_9POAL
MRSRRGGRQFEAARTGGGVLESPAAGKAQSGSAAKAATTLEQPWPLRRSEEVGDGGGEAAVKNCKGKPGEARKGQGKRQQADLGGRRTTSEESSTGCSERRHGVHNRTGLIPPVDNFGEQADPSAADVEEVEDVVRSKKKGGSRIKLGNFAPEEDVIVVKSRLEMSWDPIINTLQKKENFWQRITKRYNENRGQYPERTLRSIQSRWERIKQESEKIAGFLAENASGKSDADKTSEAAATYAGVEGHNFQFMHCWELLKDEPKWQEMMQKGVRDAAADRFGDHIPQGLNTINLDDDNPAAAASRKRPMGTDAVKASRKKNCSSVSMSSSEYASSNHSHHPDGNHSFGGNPSSYQGPCFAYQGAPAMHPPQSAEGVFHPPQIGLITPVDNFGEQADPSAADVEEVEDITRSKKKDGSRTKLSNFAPEEDVSIVKSRLEISCEPIINTGHKKENFWQRVTKRYNENRGRYPERTRRSIESRWEKIKQESEKFAGFLAESIRVNASGKSDADKTSEAAATYAGVEGHNFQFMHCWELLKDEPKWRDMIQKGGQHAAADRSGDHIPQGLNTINLDDDDPAAAASRKRPMGRDTAKASRKNCSSVSMSSSEYASTNHSHHPDGNHSFGGNPSSYQGPWFAYQGAPAMHPPPSAEGVFHPPQTGLICPVDDFGEQADPSAADVEEVEDIIRSKKKDGSRTKLSNFAPEEDVSIVKSRLEISCEPIINTGHKKENFWQRVTKRYNENRGRYPERTRRSIESRWEKIKQESEKFAGFLAESIRVNASGKSDADKTSEAAATYAVVEGHNFQFMHCWELLKDEPKWRDMIQKGGQHAAADRSGDHIPQGLNTINLGDDDPAAAASRKRPMGRDTAKASRKNCSSVSTSSSEYASKMQEISLQKMSIWQDENCNTGDRLDQLATIEEKRYDELREHNKSILQLEHEKIRIMRDKLDMQMREKEREREEREKKEDERILKIDLDSCTPELRAYYQALREEIMEKLAARRTRNQRS